MDDLGEELQLRAPASGRGHLRRPRRHGQAAGAAAGSSSSSSTRDAGLRRRAGPTTTSTSCTSASTGNDKSSQGREFQSISMDRIHKDQDDAHARARRRRQQAPSVSEVDGQGIHGDDDAPHMVASVFTGFFFVWADDAFSCPWSILNSTYSMFRVGLDVFDDEPCMKPGLVGWTRNRKDARSRAYAMELPLPALPLVKRRHNDWGRSMSEQVGVNKPRRRFTASSNSWSNKSESLVLHGIAEICLAR